MWHGELISAGQIVTSSFRVTDKVASIYLTDIFTKTTDQKYDRGLHHTTRHDLHWHEMTQQVQFRIATTVYRCLHGMAPEYPSELCFPV